MESWWGNKDISRKLLEFHHKYGRQPNLDAIRPQHDSMITKIRDQLQRDKKCITLVYTGSAYEGVQIDDNYDFDVTFVMDGTGLEIQNSVESAEHVYLKASQSFTWGPDNRYERFIHNSNNREIIPQKVVSAFFGTLQTTIEKLGYGPMIKLRNHGPAIQMDVDMPHGKYSVDMVPSFEIGGGSVHPSSKKRHFVAKPIKDQIQNNLWRESFAREESDFFRKLDKGNCCHKKVIRIMKVIRSREANLKALTSYHVKTALMYLCEKDNSESNWKEKNLVYRLMDMLGFLEEALKTKRLPHKFFTREVNLFSNIPNSTLENMYHRIRRMRSCEHIFRNILDG